MNTCKKENTLYYVVDQVYKEKTIHIIVEINKSGHIYVTIDELELFDFKQIEKIIKSAVEIIISKLFEYFDPSHQIFNEFQSLVDESVEIIDFKYKFVFKRQKFDIGKYIRCFSSIFNFVEDAEKIRLRYKRVSNFDELESMDAFLVDLINQQQTRDYIINALSRDYNITMEEAAQKFDGVLSMYRANEEMNRSTNRIFRIKNNPGFPIEILKRERTIDVEVSNINSVHYVYFLSIFINNLILLSQNIIKDDNIKQYCDVKDVKIVNIEYEPENVAPIEFTENFLNFRVKPGENIGEETEDDLFKRLEELEDGNGESGENSFGVELPQSFAPDDFIEPLKEPREVVESPEVVEPDEVVESPESVQNSSQDPNQIPIEAENIEDVEDVEDIEEVSDELQPEPLNEVMNSPVSIEPEPETQPPEEVESDEEPEVEEVEESAETPTPVEVESDEEPEVKETEEPVEEVEEVEESVETPVEVESGSNSIPDSIQSNNSFSSRPLLHA
jgi:hypothetical protein